ncbi:hypothetical protein B9W73_06995 [Lactococcus lactis]|uniref:GNAT family N-acetyltransferase n=1 Tax=Lactococcus lactis TaxID=1358 RepID=UPI000A1F31B2|nr:GNAT family N-acetyltransferase [Lactococcus lactis]OSP86998.1 hypothetical protein B9W73_06995 [Lactococcus lactis]
MRKEPISFEDLTFRTEEEFREHTKRNNCSVEKIDNYYYILSFDNCGPRIAIIENSNQSYTQIAYIDSNYYEVNKNLYIGILNVKPEFRNKGIGTSLYNYFEKITSQKLEVNIITGELDYWTEHEERVRFYTRLGFEVMPKEDSVSFLIEKRLK